MSQSQTQTQTLAPAKPSPPTKHVLALMIWLCVFPTLAVINLTFGTWLTPLPMLLRTFVLATIAVPIVIYLLMPQLHKVRGGAHQRLASAPRPVDTISTAPTKVAPPVGLSPRQRNLMRAGYLLMAVGLALVKWPLLPQAHTLPLFEGVTVCLLTAMSLLALLGLWHPVKLLPVLVFESAWKLLWLGLVALPQAVSGSLDAATTKVLINCSVVVVIIAVTPWRYVWRTYVRDVTA